MYWWGGAGYVRVDSGFWSQGYFVANQGAQVSNGDLNVYGNSWTCGGGIYALDAGIVVGPYGVVIDGNIWMNGGGLQGGGNQLTMRNGYDGGRPHRSMSTVTGGALLRPIMMVCWYRALCRDRLVCRHQPCTSPQRRQRLEARWRHVG